MEEEVASATEGMGLVVADSEALEEEATATVVVAEGATARHSCLLQCKQCHRPMESCLPRPVGTRDLRCETLLCKLEASSRTEAMRWSSRHCRRPKCFPTR